MIYLDNASTTQIDDEVLEAMMPYMKGNYGNPGNIYKLGRESANAIAKAREQVADLIGALPNEILFTSGGTEANNIAIRATKLPALRKEVLCSAVEHDSVIASVDTMRSHLSAERVFIPVDSNGVVDLSEFEKMITHRTGLVSVMYVNNETGAVNPIKAVSKICSKNNILFHTDCVQAVTCKEINVDDIGCDLLSISSHKIHGPKGVGALFARDIESLNPFVVGGKAQEYGIRSGTENVAAIVGFGKACEIQKRIGAFDYTKMREEFLGVLVRELTKYGVKSNEYFLNGKQGVNDHGKVINISFKNVDGESLVLMLDAADVCISSGSACRSHETLPSRVLKAMGLSDEEAHGSVRISFSRMTTEDDIEIGARELAKCIGVMHKLRVN